MKSLRAELESRGERRFGFCETTQSDEGFSPFGEGVGVVWMLRGHSGQDIDGASGMGFGLAKAPRATFEESKRGEGAADVDVIGSVDAFFEGDGLALAGFAFVPEPLSGQNDAQRTEGAGGLAGFGSKGLSGGIEVLPGQGGGFR